jgi:hypothetical protein
MDIEDNHFEVNNPNIFLNNSPNNDNPDLDQLFRLMFEKLEKVGKSLATEAYSDCFIADSGAQVSVVANKYLFSSFKPIKKQVCYVTFYLSRHDTLCTGQIT